MQRVVHDIPSVACSCRSKVLISTLKADAKHLWGIFSTHRNGYTSSFIDRLALTALDSHGCHVTTRQCLVSGQKRTGSSIGSVGHEATAHNKRRRWTGKEQALTQPFSTKAMHRDVYRHAQIRTNHTRSRHAPGTEPGRPTRFRPHGYKRSSRKTRFATTGCRLVTH